MSPAAPEATKMPATRRSWMRRRAASESASAGGGATVTRSLAGTAMAAASKPPAASITPLSNGGALAASEAEALSQLGGRRHPWRDDHRRVLWLPVHQRPPVQRVAGAPYLMLDGEDRLAGVRIDDIGEAELVVADALADELALLEELVRPGEVGNVDGDVVAVVVRDVLALAKDQPLVDANFDDGRRSLAVLLQAGRRAKDLLIEALDAGRGARGYSELHVGHAQGHAGRAGAIQPIVVAPGTRHVDVVTFVLPGEFGAPELVLDGAQPLFERVEVAHHEASVAPQHLRLAGRQVELLIADVDPHIVEAHGHVRVAGEAEPDNVEQRRQELVRLAHVHVLQQGDVADVLRPCLVVAFHGGHVTGRRG